MKMKMKTEMESGRTTFDGVVYEAARRMHVEADRRYATAEDMQAWESAITQLLVENGARGPEAVKWLRKQCGLNQGALAELLDLNRNTVRRWEGGEVQIPVPAWMVLVDLWADRAGTEVRLRAAVAYG